MEEHQLAHVLGLEGAIMDPISVIVVGSTYGPAFNLAESIKVILAERMS